MIPPKAPKATAKMRDKLTCSDESEVGGMRVVMDGETMLLLLMGPIVPVVATAKTGTDVKKNFKKTSAMAVDYLIWCCTINIQTYCSCMPLEIQETQKYH